MKLHVIGTGSKGNCYVLECDNEALVIETGLPFAEVKRALNFNVSKIVGVIQTHSHKDHCKHEDEYLKAGYLVFRPYLDEKRLLRRICLGGFGIASFDCVHDVPCVGYVIKHPDMGTMVYATDTEYVKYTFSRPNHILIEANYSAEIIRRDAINREHVMRGHMELETTLGCIRANASPDLRTVVLCHLSDSNSDEKLFRERAAAAVGAWCAVHVADKGVTVDLGDVPF